MKYVPGIHLINDSPVEIKINEDIAFYGHFPERNQKQFVKKMKIQYKNWMERYGFFPLKEEYETDPNFFNEYWYRKIVTNMDNLIHEPVGMRLFHA